MYNQFYKKSIQTRREILESSDHYDPALDIPLSEDTANNMIENMITTYEIPFGVVPEFEVNTVDYIIPMVTEEPSVVAALNYASKIFKRNGGVEAKVIQRVMRGEIAFSNPEDMTYMDKYIQENKEKLFEICHSSYPSIVKRGGGVVDIETRVLLHESKTNFFIVDLLVDTQEAMGANMMNTMLEALSSHLESVWNVSPLMSILSNLSTECLVEATITIDPKTLKNSDVIADRFQEASDLASLDPYRAATHNKGVMNGINALVIASGNDWRAIEASIHTYANQNPIVTWENKEGLLVGSIETIVPIATVGGSISINPKAQLAHKLMGYPKAKTLMTLVAAVGLAQNFAALYALTTDGIQKGHMRLHARSLALSAGANSDNVETVVKRLLNEPNMNLETAKAILKSL